MQTAKRNYWTQKEMEYIKNNYGYATASEIGKRLGRTAGAIRAFVARNGLSYKRGDRKSMEEFFRRQDRRVKAYSHLCWHCARSAAKPEHQCSWSANLIPVEGWETEEKGGVLKYGDEVMKRFSVVKCPCFSEE